MKGTYLSHSFNWGGGKKEKGVGVYYLSIDDRKEAKGGGSSEKKGGREKDAPFFGKKGGGETNIHPLREKNKRKQSYKKGKGENETEKEVIKSPFHPSRHKIKREKGRNNETPKKKRRRGEWELPLSSSSIRRLRRKGRKRGRKRGPLTIP